MNDPHASPSLPATVISQGTAGFSPTVAGPPGSTVPPDAGNCGAPLNLPPQLAHHSRYRVIRLLGEGGMGAVYLAEHIKMERRVALKVIRAGLLGSALAVQRFHQEVKAASRLSHPNIVTAYDADEAGEGAQTTHFLVMEFVEGQSLDDYLRARGPLPVGEACEAIRQAALGLQHAFEKGMVHRDIKPHNMIRSERGEIKILDFGLARLIRQAGDEGGAQLTGANMMMGTVDYMAPEQAGDSRSVDIRADIYSLGCTLYQLLSGSVPFPAEGLGARLLKHKSEAPARLNETRPGIPAPVAAIVNRMLAKNPADRYATPAEVAQALAPFAVAESAAVSPAFNRTGAVSPAPATLTVANDTASEAMIIQPLVPRKATAAPLEKAVAPAEKKSGFAKIAAGAAAALVLALAALWYSGAWRGKAPTAAAKAGPAKAPTASTAAAAQTEAAPAAVDVQTPAAKDAPAEVEAPVDAVASAADFLEIHGADSATFQKWMDGLGDKQMRPEYFSAQAGLDTPRFSGLAIRGGTKIKRRFVMGMNPKELKTARDNGERANETCLYWDGTQMALAVVFADNRGAMGHTYYQFDAALERLRERQKSALAVPRTISVATRPNGASWIATQCTMMGETNWEFQPDATPEQLAGLAADWRKNNKYPKLLYAYGLAPPFKFLAVAVDNPKNLDWTLRADMSVAEYEKALAENARQGLRAIAVTAYGTKEPSYAAVWIRFRAADKGAAK